MKITVTVMAHPKRKAAANALLKELKQYPFAKASITWDKVNEEWHTGKRALQAGINKGDWHVVIQDDAILTPHFYDNLVNAITALRKDTLISLYTGTARPLARRVTAAVNKAHDGWWLRHHTLFWGVGIALPSNQIKPMLDFVEGIELQYDNKIGEFYCRQGLPVYYCIPSLIDHDDDTDSLLPGHGRAISPEPRVAHRTATGPVLWTRKEIYI